MLSKFIKDIVENKEYKKELTLEFLNNNLNVKRFVVGRNEEAQYLAKTYKIDGLIDDFAAENSYWNSIPVVKLKAVPIDALVVNCATSISPVTVYNKLNQAGITNVIGYHDLLQQDTNMPLPRFVCETRADLAKNLNAWEAIYSKLYDEESRKSFLDLLAFRLTGNAEYMQSYRVRITDQYLEDFMNYSKEVFADIGGFNGDTSEEFATRYPDYQKIYFFEPSAVNMAAAKERLKDFKNITYYNFGLSDKDETLSFNENAGSASSITGSGEITIHVTTLDDIIKEPITFIKMDVEGWELNALKGSANHIKRDNPKLAIAVYHNAKDFWEIPQYILSVNNNYKLYLRHYTEGWSETIMYFKP